MNVGSTNFASYILQQLYTTTPSQETCRRFIKILMYLLPHPKLSGHARFSGQIIKSNAKCIGKMQTNISPI
jgi:hypothetical protein